MHPRPPGRHIGRDRQLSFESKFFVCRHVSIWGFQNRVCLSVRTPRKEITRLRQYQSNINKWYITGKVFTSTTTWEPKNLNFFKKVRNWILSVSREKKSPWLRQYQSYISNWYINGKVFMSTTTWKPKNLIFFFKFRNWIWLVLKSWNQHSSRSQHAPICRHRGCIVVPCGEGWDEDDVVPLEAREEAANRGNEGYEGKESKSICSGGRSLNCGSPSRNWATWSGATYSQGPDPWDEWNS